MRRISAYSKSLNRLVGIVALFTVCSSACAPATPSSGSQPGGGGSSDQPRQTRTLAAAIRIEPAFVAAKPLRQTGLTLAPRFACLTPR